MSLEAGSFIKDFVITNPEGTDPKSQGDDHLRLIKSILKTQFSGFTQGKAIDLTEDQLNRIGGQCERMGAVNINTVIPYTCIIPYTGGTTGTFPPNPVAGDMILNLCFNSANVTQYWYTRATNLLWVRWGGSGTFQPWVCHSPMSMGQTWQQFQGARAFNTNYTNTTGRPITVSIVAASADTNGKLLYLYVDGVVVAAATSVNNLISITVSAVVRPGGAYQATPTGSMNTSSWAELR